jgi:hypothetical protein
MASLEVDAMQDTVALLRTLHHFHPLLLGL